MKYSLAQNVLRKFERETANLPEFENEKEEKMFLQLQKYNLLYVTAKGMFKITRKGEEALKGDVEKFLQLERFEEKMIKESLRRSTERKWMVFAIIPLIAIMTILLVLLQAF